MTVSVILVTKSQALPTLTIKGNAKLQLEICEKEEVIISCTGPGGPGVLTSPGKWEQPGAEKRSQLRGLEEKFFGHPGLK